MSWSKARRRARGVWLLALLALAACDLPSIQTSDAPGAMPDARQVLRLSVTNAIVFDGADGLSLLDPARSGAEESGASQIVTLLYSGLMTYDAHLRPIPALADRISVSADGLRYTFHIRRGARFNDGTPITSADTAYSIARLILGRQPDVGAFFDALVGYDAIMPLQPAHSDGEIAYDLTNGPLAHALLTPDPATLIIRLSHPDGALLSKLAAPYSGVAERALALRYSNDWPGHLADPDVRGASGMYAVTDWRAATRAAPMTLTLTRSARYWGARPRLRQIVVTFGSDMTGLATVAYRNGLQDVTLDASQDPNVGAARLPGYHTTSRRFLALLYFNPTIAPLDNLRVRQALALALDRRALASQALAGMTPAATLIPARTPGYIANVAGPIAGAPPTGDASAARALWLGYVHDCCRDQASSCPPLSLCDDAPYCGSDSALTAELIAQWKAALPGIRITTLVWVGLLGSPPDYGGASVVIGRWYEDYPDPQDWTTAIMRFAPWSANSPGLALAAAAETAPTADVRLRDYQQAQSALINNAETLPLAWGRYAWLARRGVADFPADPLPWITPEEWARVYLTSATG